MLTEASYHRSPACGVSVDKFFKVIFARDFYLVSLDGKICTKDSSGNSSTVSAVAKVSSTMTGEEFRIVHFYSDGTT